MVKIHALFFFALIVLTLSCNHSKKLDETGTSSRLTLDMIGKEYDSLFLLVYDNEMTLSKITGEKTSKFRWEFTYPDSIYQRSSFMKLRTSKLNDSTNYLINMHLLNNNNDTIRKNSFRYTPNTTIQAVFYEDSYASKLPYWNIDRTEITPMDTKFDNFLYKETTTSDLSLMANDTLTISRFDKLSYDANLLAFINLVKSNRRSHYLLVKLYEAYPEFDSHEDILAVYNQFDEESKSSYYGQLINKYLESNIFENVALKNTKSGAIENILKENEYTLLIFSASWCQPCHKLLPSLKEIHEDLGESLDMVYISIDDENTINSWFKWEQENKIPWRSYSTVSDNVEIQKKYGVRSIPYMFLVFPDKSYKIIDIRNVDDLNNLYKIFNCSITKD